MNKIPGALIVGILCFLLAKGTVYLYAHATEKVPPGWVFPMALILSPFLLIVLFFLFAIFFALCCGIIVWIGEKWKLWEKGKKA